MWIHKRILRPILKSIVGESYLRQKGVLGFDFKHLSLSTVKQAAGIVRSKPSKAQSKVAGASWQSWSGCDQCFCASILNLWCAHSQKCRRQNQQNDDLFLSLSLPPSSIGHAVICLIIFDWHMSHSSCIPPLLCRTRFCQEHPLKQAVWQNKCHQQTSRSQTIGCEVWILQAEKNCSKCHGDQSHLWWKGLVQDILHPRWEHQGLNEERKERAKIQENSSWTAMLKSVCCQLN